jgi:REP element-mobilizing transposase RayT
VKQGKLSESLPLGSKERGKSKRDFEAPTSHGGRESVGKRKTTRPYSPKSSIHIVLKSKRARGTWSLRHRKNQSKITAMIYVYAARFKVHVYRAANVGDHIHLLVKSSDRKALADYLRVLAGRIAVTVSGAQKGVKRIGKFWDHLCWSRLVKWGREFHVVQRYVFANELEFLGKHIREAVRRNPYLIPDPGEEFG